MAQFTSDTRGNLDDRVRITLGGEDVLIAESYTVKQSMLTQPAIWSIRLGHADAVAQLLKKYPPNTPYKLYIGDVLQQSGRLDDQEANGDANGSSVTFSGRDGMALLVDACIVADKSYTSESYAEVVRSVLAEVAPGAALVFTNETNRSVQAGTTVIQSDLPIDPVAIPTSAAKERPMRAKAGQRQYQFLKDQLDRAGLFLFCAADGSYVLTAPNGGQQPITRIVRRRGQHGDIANVVSYRYRNATSSRYSTALIHGCGGGGKAGRQKTKGLFDDEEMLGYGFDRPLVIRDKKSSTGGHAETIARRKIAESRRTGWNLTYTLAGHTAPKLNSYDRVVWAVDTVVEVDDQEIGLSGTFWVESVEFSRGPETKTVITLMRPEDLVFGGEDEN